MSITTGGFHRSTLIMLGRLFYIFTSQFAQLPFLRASPDEAGAASEPRAFTEDDDLDLCIYYMRTMSNVFRWAPDAIWGILATKTVAPEDLSGLSEISESSPHKPRST